MEWSETQAARLKELGAASDDIAFEDTEERDAAFQEFEGTLARKNRELLLEQQRASGFSNLYGLSHSLTEALNTAGFTRVETPIIMSCSHLANMGIGDDHPLMRQVFRLDCKHCLRPMLAPHLYSLLRDLGRVWSKPVRIFEIGPCFRKESRGSRHAAEFTMLNLVEMGLDAEDCFTRLEELADLVTRTAGIDDARLERQESAVYGETVDVVSGDLELGSCAIGPHPLDGYWGVTLPWVGLGFGLERLLMLRAGDESLGRWTKSLGYLNGISLRV